MYRVQGDQLGAIASIIARTADLDAGASEQDLLDEQQRVSQEMAAVLTGYVDSVQRIEPPARAAEFHAGLVASSELIAQEASALLADLTSGEIDVMLQAQQDQAALLETMLADSRGLTDTLAAMVEEVLAGREDAESRYIIALLGLRSSDAVAQIQALLSDLDPTAANSPDGLAELINQIIGLFEAARAEYAAITPPERWTELHNDQIELLDDGIALYSRFGEILEGVLEDPESVDIDELEELLKDLVGWAARGPARSAAMSYQFAEYFEELA